MSIKNADKRIGVELFADLSKVPPSFAPAHTPGYSNLGYQLIAYALEGITRRRFIDMLEDDIIQKLVLNNTYFYQTPPSALGVIPPGNEFGWNYSLGESSP
jgi:CubicO group peptidase (beta-lactamase class C family)